MDYQIQGSARMHNEESHTEQNTTEKIVSVARRRALKAGLVAVPVMVTLRSKPLFGQGGGNLCASLSLSAAQSHGVSTEPNCNPKG
jgi:hypothetical protein